MGMKARLAMLSLLLCLAVLLSGCRMRTTAPGPGQSDSGAASAAAGGSLPGESASAGAASGGEPQEEADREENRDESGEITRENPEASRKEYDEHAPVEIVAGTDRLLQSDGEGTGSSRVGEEAGGRADRLNDQAEKTATQTVPVQQAEERGVSEDAEAADSAMTYYTVLLQDRAGSLFECQRANVYWETPSDHVTIHKTSPEHALILGAGAYDVSARLLPENLRVDDGWVVRKNPQVIVKVVDGGVLGGTVHDSGKAASLCQDLMAREGWASVDAVRNRRILLLSEELLEAPFLQLAAMVMIAKTSDAALYADVDPDRALSMLMEEAAGTQPSGIFYYSVAEEGI